MSELPSNAEWKKWGEIDPLYGVAAWKGREKTGDNPWTDEDFYNLGESDWGDFERHWKAYGLNDESCLEIGCGAGRVTKQLARYFQQVHALDISDKMLEYAKRNINSPAVAFHLSDGIKIPLADRSIASVFSTHVFQHFDSLSVASRYFAEISRVMKPDGTLMIHLPIYSWPTMARYFSFLYAVRRRFGDFKAAAARRLMSFGMASPIMRGTHYPIGFFFRELPKFGFRDIEISIFVTKINNDPHPFVFARRQP